MHTANTDNLILATDSYKLGHWNQYPKDTEAVYSYFESRPGARFPYTVFFGLQYLLKRYLVGNVVTWDDLSEANRLAHAHFNDARVFNYQGWSHIIEHHGGRLPLRIKAVAEGTLVPTGNVLMTVESTDPKCFWLTNAVESLLTHVWYPSTVATLSHHTKALIGSALAETATHTDGLPFMLHDFGYRSASSHEAAGIGGAAHLVNSMGTDTLPGMLMALEYYAADLDGLAYSVPATEHSVMTALGEHGEMDVVAQLLDEHPSGILSIVADSYNIYDFVRNLGDMFYVDVTARDGVLVVRPDSVTPHDHPEPGQLVVWIAEQLWRDFGGSVNSKGYKILDSHVRILWGDGIDPSGIEQILAALALHSFSAENLVFGMGGGLLQKIDRDTQRFAFKASAIKRSGEWHDMWKKPLDESKASKRGRLALINDTWTHVGGDPVGLTTVPLEQRADSFNVLETVFMNGELVKEYTFADVRANASASVLATA